MNGTLLDAVRRYTEAYSDPTGIARSSICGLTVIRSTSPGGLEYAISRPLVCVVLQGGKTVRVGSEIYAFSAGESLLISGNVPTISQITCASSAKPYYSLALDLDLTVIAELAAEMKLSPVRRGASVRVAPTNAEVTDVAFRLMRLMEHPSALPVLNKQLVREMHYWLLVSTHGQTIRQLGWTECHVQRVARAVALLRAKFAQSLPVERLAAEAGMSPSSFYQHFRAATSLSPLQFQKQLRLIEARRLMMSDGKSSSSAAFAVGYESVQQFTRDYHRMFGLPPRRDADAARRFVEATA